MLFYDFEVFKYDWLVVIYDSSKQKWFKIWNSEDLLTKFYNENSNQIWIGFNNRHYDQYILKGIILGMNPKSINDRIIQNGENGWRVVPKGRSIRMINFDVMVRGEGGLKSLEGMMGHNIYESNIPFDIERKLTPEEMRETEKYCRNDVKETMEIFYTRVEDFNAEFELIKLYNLPFDYFGKTKVQLSAMILNAHKHKYDDEFDITIPTNLDIVKYKHVVKWFESEESKHYTDNKYKCEVAGVPHIFAWGGVHGAIEKYHGKGCFLNMDVASLYPNLMINYNLYSRSCDASKFKDIVDLRLKYKAEKNPIQKALKIVINGTYGAMKDKNNALYDPLMANNVCVHGQLLMLDLMEHLEPYCEIIQSNTDGVLVKLKNFDSDYDKIDDIAYEWEQRTGLVLEFDTYVEVYQKDVNNYVVIDQDRNYKSKGGYVKKLNKLDYDLPIVNEAIINYMKDKKPVTKTIMECSDLKKFQMIRKISGKYEHIKHGNEILNVKCIRCFALKNTTGEDKSLKKLHKKKQKYEKIAGTPNNSFLILDNLENHIIIDYINKLNFSWYIKLAKSRLKDFGIEVIE